MKPVAHVRPRASGLTRRLFLRLSVLVGTSLSLPRLAWMQAQTPEATPEPSLPLTGTIRQIHDPCIIKAGDTYYVYCTGEGILARTSNDLIDWSTPFPASVFVDTPAWARTAIPGATNIWAPDISFYGGSYHLYYAVSTFGSNRSVIGLATNTTLDPQADGFNWVDEGLVIESQASDTYNCIDPNLVLDADGNAWLAFGSFWSGIKLRRLDLATGKPSDADQTLYALARRFEESGSIEGSFIIRRNGYYYLFVSFGFCCQGASSDYRVMVGRSENITGPYADRDGAAMLDGGGTQVVYPSQRWYAPGHNAILRDNGVDYIVYHALDAETFGAPTLRINRLAWDGEGWPQPVTPD